MSLRIHAAPLAVAALLLAPAGLHAQHQHGHMAQHAQQMHHGQQMQHDMMRMDSLQMRLDHMHRMMSLHQGTQHPQHEQMRALCHALHHTAGSVRTGMEQIRAMALAPEFQDAESQAEIARLSQHWAAMTNQMEAGLRLLENLHTRIGGG